MKTHFNVEDDVLENPSMNFISYTCTNHPEVIVNEPGKCPHCGKDLVKKY